MKNLNLPISILITLLLLHSYVMSEDPCEDRNITGAVGGAVTLHVRYTGIPKIIWSFEKIKGSIATTRPGGLIEIDNNKYKGRLSSTPDGSLIIPELRLEDQGTYQLQINTDKETLHCNYHLTVFSNLTVQDVTISSNVTDNNTCEVSFTCSVNGSNVIVTWRSVNSSDITGTQNVVFVPPRNVNFTYICTAKNPISNVSKVVHPWEYCKKEKTDSDEHKRKFYIGGVVSCCLIVIIVVLVFFWIFRRKKKKSEDLNKNAGSKTPNVKQPTPSRAKGTAGMSKNPQAMELQESQPNETTDKTLYSTVQHVKAIEPQVSQSNDTTSNTLYSTVQQPKQKNKQTKQPSPSKGHPTKAPPKPPHIVLEPPKDKNDQKSPSEGPNRNCSKAPLESCYAEVQLPKDKNDQKSPSEGPNGDCSKAPLESHYEQVQLPKDKNDQKSPSKGPNRNCSKAPLESHYEQVQLLKPVEQ